MIIMIPIAFLVFLVLFVWGTSLMIHLTILPASTPAVRRAAIRNFIDMLILFSMATTTLGAIRDGLGTTIPERQLFVFFFILSGLGFTVPLLAQINLWARCELLGRTPAVLPVANRGSE